MLQGRPQLHELAHVPAGWVDDAYGDDCDTYGSGGYCEQWGTDVGTGGVTANEPQTEARVRTETRVDEKKIF